MSSPVRTDGPEPSACTPSEIGRTEGRYLLAVRRLSEPTADRIATDELRRFLDVSAASVSEMLAKLDERGLADHEKYHGVTLTSRGERVAEALARRFCVVTTFFSSVLNAELDDETAYEIGVTLPESGVSSLRERIDRPCIENCPETTPGCAECAA